MKTALEALLCQALDALPDAVLARAVRTVDVEVETPRDAAHGDFASNLALRLASHAATPSRALAEALLRAMPASPLLARTEIAGSGFINFFLSDEAYHAQLGIALEAGDAWGRAAGADDRPRVARRVADQEAGAPSVDEARQIFYADALSSLREAADYRAPGVEEAAPRPVQPVTLVQGTDRRAGRRESLAALRALIGEDAARLFLVLRDPDHPLDLDVALARQRTCDNPLFCIQYAHARVCSAFRELEARGFVHDRRQGLCSLGRLRGPHEAVLQRRIAAYPGYLEHCARTRAPHALVHYLRMLAEELHAYHAAHACIVADAALRDARLVLAMAVQTTIRNGLALLGVAAPATV